MFLYKNKYYNLIDLSCAEPALRNYTQPFKLMIKLDIKRFSTFTRRKGNTTQPPRLREFFRESFFTFKSY